MEELGAAPAELARAKEKLRATKAAELARSGEETAGALSWSRGGENECGLGWSWARGRDERLGLGAEGREVTWRLAGQPC